jgi:hypothetical protein
MQVATVRADADYQKEPVIISDLPEWSEIAANEIVSSRPRGRPRRWITRFNDPLGAWDELAAYREWQQRQYPGFEDARPIIQLTDSDES